MSDLTAARQTARSLEDAVRTVVRGQDTALRNILACLAGGGHALVEDVPGTGKTTLAKAIAKSVDGAAFKRVQFTPDLLPGDILGVSIFDPRTQEFRFRPGPVFADILLADEINRASPRTQSALLEAMAERQATIDGERHDLDGLFFVIATQNPVEFRGTYPLPEAQMDRFMIQSRLGYVTPEEERAILSDQIEQHPVDLLQPVVNRDDLVGLLAATRTVRISDELRGYIVDIVSATRGRDDVQLAASPRASIALMKMAQALSLFEERDFVVPETIQTVAADVIAHRMVIAPEAKLSGVTGRQVITDILASIPVPV
ncbi:MoxR family ATPase [Luteolibacter sp. GHJ8]|uniref:MoxR family ATPase n=1 Tax=Luteolibacter rhizosphaerae TaxID=2989719 RepID=A0ABT3FYQ0_9BACT|nr:MoxR family ATPase [Luteolibacter rhizosphaerae]MCW1912712.1 MoxR family ATPase [Luteolibacter rhizosphaerae]